MDPIYNDNDEEYKNKKLNFTIPPPTYQDIQKKKMEIQQARRGTNREYGYTRHPRYTDSYEKPNDYGSRYNIPEKRQRLYDDRREYINRDGASSGSDRRGENKSVDFVAKSEKVENSVSDHADRQIKYRSMLIKDLGQYPYDVEEFFQHLSPRYANEDDLNVEDYLFDRAFEARLRKLKESVLRAPTTASEHAMKKVNEFSEIGKLNFKYEETVELAELDSELKLIGDDVRKLRTISELVVDDSNGRLGEYFSYRGEQANVKNEMIDIQIAKEKTSQAFVGDGKRIIFSKPENFVEKICESFADDVGDTNEQGARESRKRKNNVILANLASRYSQKLNTHHDHINSEVVMHLLQLLILVLSSMADDGTLVMKLENCNFLVVSEVVFILYTLFKESKLVKPVSSLPFDESRYLVCVGYTRNKAIREKLLDYFTELYLDNIEKAESNPLELFNILNDDEGLGDTGLSGRRGSEEKTKKHRKKLMINSLFGNSINQNDRGRSNNPQFVEFYRRNSVFFKSIYSANIEIGLLVQKMLELVCKVLDHRSNAVPAFQYSSISRDCLSRWKLS